MEKILEKNIFKDHELHKLSPDYNPTGIILRMQMRRSLVKDSHSTRPTRQNLKRKKECSEASKVMKEIVRLKNKFEKKNMKNDIELKNFTNVKLTKYRKVFGSKFNSAECTDFKIEDFEVGLNEELTKEYDDGIIESVRLNNDISLATDFAMKHNHTSEANPEKTNSTHNLVEILQHSSECSPPPNEDLQSMLIRMALTSNPIDDPNDKALANEIITKEEASEHEIKFTHLVLLPTPLQNDEYMDFLNIKHLKSVKDEREAYLKEKFVRKWQKYVAKRKVSSSERQTALNNFFDKLDKKKCDPTHKGGPTDKASLNAKDYSNYHHRYKVQRHIIALQKAKLDEQNRIIEELKYNRIVDASRNSVEAMKEEVRKTYFEIDRHLKPKIKCLTNELKIPEIEEPSLVLHCLKVPQFLQRMEKRAREREEKHAVIRERRRQMEEERLRIKQQAELAKLEMDKEEKTKRIKDLKEKRKRERIENIRKKQHSERMRALTVMADLHYEKNLVSRCGLQPWKRLLQIKRDNVERATEHFEFQLLKNTFLHWMWHTEDMWMERNYKAEDCYRKNMLRKVFEALKKEHHEFVLQRQVAEDYYDLYVTQLVFRKFRAGVARAKEEQEMWLKRAEAYHDSNLLFKTFTCWRTLPALNRLKREQDARKARWREKVLQVVPDYRPPED